MALKECKVCGKLFENDLAHFVPVSRESKKLSSLCWSCHTKRKARRQFSQGDSVLKGIELISSWQYRKVTEKQPG
jgi:5-methylcytosine-specific restriction endonuclease McrA